ncbi:MAG: hypothetical protein R3E13_11075 [Alphaproteobacteria bacterium]
MLESHIEETSKGGPAAALDLVLKKAVNKRKEFARADFILKDITKLPQGAWKAKLDIFAEPKRKKNKTTPDLDPAPAIKEAIEREDRAQKGKKAEHAHQLEDFYHERLVEQLDYEYGLEQEGYEMLVLYAELQLEGVVMGTAPQYDFTAIHFLPEGSLSRAAQEKHPSLWLYEAAHCTSQEGNVFTWTLGEPEPDLKPSRSHSLFPELSEE